MKDLLLPLQGKPVDNEDLEGQQETSHLAMVQSNTQEVQGASPVHGRASDIEWESGNGSIHEDAEVVTQVGTSDTQSPHAGKNQNRSPGEQKTAHDGLVDGGIEWLVSQRQLVNVVAQDAQREDGEGEEVASLVWAPKDLS